MNRGYKTKVKESKEPLTIDPILSTSVGFAEGILGLPLYQWQKDVLFDCDDWMNFGQIAVRCPNEAGKTTHIAAAAILRFLSVYPNALAVATSGSSRQIKDQLMPSLKSYENLDVFKDWNFQDQRVITPSGGFLSAFSTDEAGRFEGYHKRKEIEIAPGLFELPPLMMVVDEAKTVRDPIFDSIARCRPDLLLMLSSPGEQKGKFFRAFHRNAQLYRRHNVGLKDCPHFDPVKIKRVIDEYGEDHPFVKSTIHGEWADDVSDGTIITRSSLEQLIANPPNYKPGDRHAAMDFAAGGDENTFALRKGNRVELKRAWRETNTMAAVGEFVVLIRSLGLKQGEVSADEGGLGKSMIDRLEEVLGWNINRVNFGSPALQKENYANKAAEIWDKGRSMIVKKEMIIVHDELMVEQMSSRKWKRFSDSKLFIQPKQEMKKEGEQSPDRAEAVLMAMQPKPQIEAIPVMSDFLTPSQYLENELEAVLLPGAQA